MKKEKIIIKSDANLLPLFAPDIKTIIAWGIFNIASVSCP